jgi:hypothetical protein
MTTPFREITKVSASTESSHRAAEFVQAAKVLMLAHMQGGPPVEIAERRRLSPRVIDFVRSAQTAGSMSGTWGEQLAIRNLANGFLGSLSSISVFDLLWPNFLQVPLRTSILSVSATLTATPIAEANVKPLSKISLTAGDLDGVKVIGLLGITAEVLKITDPVATNLLRAELARAISRAGNTYLLPVLTSGASSFASSGTTATAIRQDIRTLLAAVSSGAGSKLYLIVPPVIAEAWSIVGDASGAAAFPTCTFDGGSLAGIPVVVCNEAVATEIILCDATQIAAGQEGTLTIDATTEASFDFSDPGDSPVSASTNMISLWQNDLAALKAERIIGAKLLRTTAAAKITGAAYTGNSPA